MGRLENEIMRFARELPGLSEREVTLRRKALMSRMRRLMLDAEWRGVEWERQRAWNAQMAGTMFAQEA